MARRRLITLSVAVACVLASTGCSVPDDGWVGIGRTNGGQFRVYVRTCTHPVDGATLYWPGDPKGASHEEVFADWQVTNPQSGPSRIDWPLLGSTSGEVVSSRSMTSIPEPPKNLAIYAWTNDNTTAARGPFQFRAFDLEQLKAGEVLVSNNTGNDGDPTTKVISRSAFDALDCREFQPS